VGVPGVIDNFILINGNSTPSAVPLLLAGAQGIGGGCGIYPDVSAGLSSLSLGASSVATNTININQNSGSGFVDIGGNGGQGVRLSGVSSGALVQGGIITSTAGASGQLILGGSSGNSNTINITDASAVFDQQIVQTVPGTVTYDPSNVYVAATTTSGTYYFDISGFPTGLYLCMIRINTANISDGNTCANMSSGLVYLLKTGGDGSTIVVGGGTFGNTNISITAYSVGSPGAQLMQIVVNGVYYFNVKLLQLTGSLPGFNT
jgi:hypothetical protein